MSLYFHIPHPHIAARRETGPVRTAGERNGFNGKIGLAITTLVGTMVCGYVFAALALLSLPSAISTHNLTIIIAWVSSNFLQLVLLPVIIVGQNIQARATDKRADQTYQDAEAVLAEALKIQEHLAAQDDVLTRLGRLDGTVADLAEAIQVVMAARTAAAAPAPVVSMPAPPPVPKAAAAKRLATKVERGKEKGLAGEPCD